MIKDARIEDEYLIFEGDKGYYNIDLGAIDMFGRYFSKKMQIIASNGRTLVEDVENDEYNQIKDLILNDPRFLIIDDYIVINLDNLNSCRVVHSRMDIYNLDLKFFQTLSVIGSKNECEKMKSMIDNAIQSRNNEIESNL